MKAYPLISIRKQITDRFRIQEEGFNYIKINMSRGPGNYVGVSMVKGY